MLQNLRAEGRVSLKRGELTIDIMIWGMSELIGPERTPRVLML